MNPEDMQQPHHKRKRLKRNLVQVVVSLHIVMITAFGAIGVFAPKQASAVPSEVLLDIPAAVQIVKDFIQDGLVTAGKVGIKNALRSFLEKLAYDYATWLGSGDWKQKPFIEPQNVGDYIKSSGDAALGSFLNTVANQNGYAQLNLCQLPEAQSLKFKILLPKLTGVAGPDAKQPYTPTCKASDQWSQLTTRYDKALSIIEDPDSFVSFSTGFERGESGFSTLLAAWDEAIGAQTAAEREAEIDRLKSDLNPKESKISEFVQTPAGFMEAQLEATISQATEAETIQQDNIVADALSIFVNTLASKWMDRLSSGVISFFTETDINDAVAGYSSTTGSSGGIAGAQEKFASFKTPSFNKGGEIDILTHFANCPDQGQDVTNCVIDEGWRSAIDEHLTLRQAVETGRISAESSFGNAAATTETENGTQVLPPTQDLSERSVTILKRYSVIPATWELAAEYYQDFDRERTDRLTIAELMDAYDNCGADDYSPYCGLVDPDWVLKAPEVFCKLEGYGEVIATDQFEDLDGNPYSGDERLVARLNSCLDAQSCLSEDDSGNCEAYGYCTKQRDIYRFAGESCPVQQASCDVFENADGDEFGYLQNTLNFNDCSESNAGCTWYCSEKDADGNYTCTDQTATNSILFDDDVATCSADAVGCSEFIPMSGGANLLFNPGFEQFNEFRRPTDANIADLPSIYATAADAPYTDTDANTFGFYDAAGGGAPCIDSSSGTCYGWEKVDSVQTRVAQEDVEGLVVAQLQSGNGHIQSTTDTGYALADRSFVFSFTALNTSDQPGCTGQYWIETGSGSGNQTFSVEYPVAQAQAGDAEFTSTGGFQQVSSGRITFGPNITATSVRVGIAAANGCDIAVDNAKLEENTGGSGFSEYGQDRIHLNLSQALTCTEDEIGCLLYEPQTGESAIDIPGTITNPYSAACGNGDDFSNPACSQCTAETVGCDAYIEEETPFTAPIKNVEEFANPDALSEQTKRGIATRTGKYCDGTAVSCSTDTDCTGGLACLPSISVIPDTGEQCSASAVGCEEYVNLDSVAAGGEELEYYKYIKQCVKPTAAQETTTETYYTFEGSDVSGYQIRSWNLKKSNIDDGPCTNLDLYGDTSQSPEANCVDTADSQLTCSPDEVGSLSNPDCTEYFDSANNKYYIQKSATITVSDECVGLRNTLDDRVYYSIPSESESCSAQDNLCREYQGSQGGNVQVLVEEDFNAAVWGGDASLDVVTANTGFSMALGSGVGETRASVYVGDDINPDHSYVVSFWAKKSDAADGATVDPFFFSQTTGETRKFEDPGVNISTEWKLYQAGPFVFNNDAVGDEAFGFEYTGTQVNIDNVIVYNSSSHYLIHGSADICNGFEGCEEYRDSNGQTEYLKSFATLCDENSVGCQALFDTHNSDLPYYEEFNTENNGPANEFTEDDVTVPADNPVAYVVNDDVRCNGEDAGCTAFGEPTLNASGTTDADGDGTPDEGSFTEVYLLNDPDTYSTALCQNQQLDCREWTRSDGTVTYFKDPGEKTCIYDATQGKWIKPDGTDCPLQNENVGATPSQPKGPVCVGGGPRDGLLCNADSDCRTDDDNSPLYLCSSQASDDSGWAGSCGEEYAGCTAYIDPNTPSDITNGGFDVDIKFNDDITVIQPDGLPDDWKLYGQQDDGDDVAGPNAFYTSFGYDGTTVCANAEVATDPTFAGQYAFELQTGGGAEHCMFLSQIIPVDSNTTHTLRGHVRVSSADAELGIGLLFYDEDGDEIAVPDATPEDFAVAAYEGGARSTETTDRTNEWLRFAGTVGPNLNRSFPVGTQFVKVFVETGNTGETVYFDSVEFSQDDVYTYINETVDGAPQSDVASCPDGVNIGDGCVAFRDSTSDSLNQLSTIEEELDVNSSYNFEACSFDTGADSDACRSQVNTADTNLVIRVEQDRECAEWLSCATESRTQGEDGAVDASQNCFESGNCSCLEIRTCTKRNEETGACVRWAPQIPSNEIGYSDDVSVTSQPGDDSQVQAARDISGFAKIGAEWVGGFCQIAEGQTAGTCSGGANHGAECSADEECIDAQSFGFYPYSWMPQRGLSGGLKSQDLVEDGDFEDSYCVGTGTYDYGNLASADAAEETAIANAVERTRDKSMKCTIDRHCRTPETDAQLQANYSGNANIAEIEYEEGWCENVEDGNTWGDAPWTAHGANTQMRILDYQSDLNYEPTNASIIGKNLQAESLDLNNVMYVEPREDDVQEGVQVAIGTGIAPEGEYTLSFDAQYAGEPTVDDFTQVGLQHGADANAVDFFEVGTAAADIVFLVDASSSMGDRIQNVANNTGALVAGLEEAGLDFRVAIVTTGGTRQPEVLDYADFGGGESTAYGAANGITTDFTTSTAQFQSAMSAVAGSLDSGLVFNYDALKQIADNVIEGSAGDYELKYRPGAERFVVLLTDAKPENGDSYITGGVNPTVWESADEDLFIPEFDKTPYSLYTVTSTQQQDEFCSTSSTSCSYQAYDALSASFGGEMYNIDAADYGELLTSITEDMNTKVSDFKFSTSYEHYVLGPITIEGKDDPGDQTTLFIREAVDGTNVPFVIDNVSLKPALEVNKENNPHSKNSTWMSGQSCRAYPESDSLSCSYTDTNGVIYSGWKGYCLEYDASLPDKCLTWWPIDVIAGEVSRTTSREILEYNQKIPAYHCLVAKGNADLGACIDDGTMCLSNSDCGDNKCLGNGTVSFSSSEETISVETGGYTALHRINSLIIDKDSSHANGDGITNKTEFAKFRRFDPSPVEKLLHISEIDKIDFNLGLPIYDKTDDYSEEKLAWAMSVYDPEAGFDPANGFDSVQWELSPNADGQMFQAEYNDIDGAFEHEGAGNNEDGSYAWQAGAWCGSQAGADGLCDANSTAGAVDDMDFIFVKGVANYDARENIRESGRVFNSPGFTDDVPTEAVPFNPFNQFAPLKKESGSNGKAWSGGGVEGEISSSNSVDGVAFDKGYFFSRYSDDADLSERNCYGATSPCGANVMGVKFDFEDGYLQNVYLFYWDGFRRFDAREMVDIEWTYYLREPCLLVAEGATDEAVATPWYDRIQEDSGYRIQDIQYAHTTNGANELFGSYGTDAAGSAPDGTDSLQENGLNDLTAKGKNLPMVFLNGGQGTALPYACIGSCNDIACTNDYDAEYGDDQCDNDMWTGVAGVCSQTDSDGEAYFCNDNSDCEDVGGTCIGIDDSQTQGAQFAPPVDQCDPADTDCDIGDEELDGSSDYCQENPDHPYCTGERPPIISVPERGALSGGGVGASYGTYLEQLNAAAKAGWDRYRLLFADFNRFWFADELSDSDVRYTEALTEWTDGGTEGEHIKTKADFCPEKEGFDCDAFNEDSENGDAITDFNDTDTLRVCSDGTRDAGEYCGLRPTVANIELNDGNTGDILVESGGSVVLTFDSEADPSQEPLDIIRITWDGEDGTAFDEEFSGEADPWEAASTTGHYYKHAYTCDPTDGSYNSDLKRCEYKVKIQIQDAWGFCSGDIHDDGSEDFVRDVNSAPCSSYSQYNGTVFVKLPQ